MKPVLPILAFIAAFTAFAVGPSFAEPAGQNQAFVSGQDPLMRQIMHRHMTRADGGITAVVRVATGQSIKLQVIDLGTMSLLGGQRALTEPADGATPSLRPAKELLPKKEKSSPKKRKVTRAAEQLKTLKKQGKKQSW